MCTDNAAMIAAAGYFQLERSGPTPLDAGAVPDLQLRQLQVALSGRGCQRRSLTVSLALVSREC